MSKDAVSGLNISQPVSQQRFVVDIITWRHILLMEDCHAAITQNTP